MGNGFFSKNITYAQWFKMNNNLRVHYNFLEHVPLVTTLILVNGIILPTTSLVIGIIYILARIAFTIGYMIGGPNARLPGALTGTLCTLALFGCSIYGIYYTFNEASKAVTI